ncbi:MAG: type IX secretion system outer membrane channel protein PorV [Bacteroidota bacterium]
MNNRIFSILTFFVVIISSTTLMGQSSPGVVIGQDTERRVITTAVPFLGITPDARAGALGDAGVATSADANSIHWNPAKLVFVDHNMGFALSYSPWLAKIINDMSLSYLSGYYKISKEQAVAVSMRYFDLGDIFFTDINNLPKGNFNPKEFAFDVAYSRMLTESFSLGIVARYVHSNLTGSFSYSTLEAKPGNTASVDISAFYTKDFQNSNLSLGGNISNIGAKLSYSNEDNKDFIPINLRLGSSYTTHIDPYNSITVALDFNKLLVPTPPIYERDADGVIIVDPDDNPVIERGKDPDRPLLSGMFGSFSDAPDGFSEEMQEIMLAFGAEYWYNKTFAGRAGYFYEHYNKGNRKYLTLGVGFRYNVFGIDFAYLIPQKQDHPLAETLRFTLLFNFDPVSAIDESVTDE